MEREALKLALEALEEAHYKVEHKQDAAKREQAITAIKEALAQPAQEPVAKPYAYEYGRCNADGTYSVVIERGDLVQTMPAVYNYVRPRNAHKDWPIKELFDAPPQREWADLTYEDWKKIEDMPDTFYQGVAWAQAKLKEKNA